MLLKRYYKLDAEGNAAGLDFIAIGHTGVKPEQNFSIGLVHAGIAEGWIKTDNGKLFIVGKHFVNGKWAPVTLSYTIKRTPGEYVVRGRREITHAFECVLDTVQHSAFAAKPGKAPHFPSQRREAANG